MDLSIGTTFNYAIPLKEQLPMIRAAGFTHISLGGGDLAHSNYLDADGRKALNKFMSGFGMKICSLHVPFRAGVDISLPERGPSAAGRELIRQCIDAAEELAAGVVIFHPGPDHAEHDPRRKGMLAGQVIKLIEHIGNRPIRLAVENVRNEALNRALGGSLDAVSDPRYGLCYDTSHDNLAARPMGILLEYGTRLIAVHVSDNRGEKDDHLLPFEGVIDWKKFCGIFARLKYTGKFLLEVEMRESSFHDPVEFLREACTRGKKLLQLSGQS